jgi:polysaccharide biosynthesis protein PslH
VPVHKHPTILFISEKFPWPLDDGGQIRTFQMLKALASESRVILIALAPASVQNEEAVRDLGIEVVTFPSAKRKWKIPWQLLQALFTRRPYPLPKNFSRPILSEIRRRIETENIRELYFNHLDAAQYIEWLEGVQPPVRAVCDTHNVLSVFYERMFTSERNLFRKAYCWLQWRKMERYEKAILRKCDRVIVCSEVERQLVENWGLTSCTVVPNGVDVNFFTSSAPSASAQYLGAAAHLVFTGAMDYYPNSEGVRWFLESVAPELARRLANYRVTIVGKNPPSDLLVYQDPGKVEFTGFVEDVRPYTRSADIFIVPLRVAGGTRLKILEALAMRVPVVSTSVGAEGLDLENRTHLRLADTPAEMVEAIAQLLSDRERANEMAEAGCRKVRKEYSWDKVAAPLAAYYKSIPVPYLS